MKRLLIFILLVLLSAILFLCYLSNEDKRLISNYEIMISDHMDEYANTNFRVFDNLEKSDDIFKAIKGNNLMLKSLNKSLDENLKNFDCDNANFESNRYLLKSSKDYFEKALLAGKEISAELDRANQDNFSVNDYLALKLKLTEVHQNCMKGKNELNKLKQENDSACSLIKIALQ